MGLILSLVLVVGSIPLAASGADEGLPVLTGSEFNELFNSADLPGLTSLSSPPDVTGVASTDSRIRALAEARGYRLRPVLDGSLSSADGHSMQGPVVDAWESLQAAARSAGHSLVIHSAYRSISTQRSGFLRRLAGRTSDSAIESVLRYSAPPGYSKHQTGYAIDVRNAGGTLGDFGSSAAFRWLSADNYAQAKRFGFIPSYPPDGGLQGPQPEPWEYTWVGVDAIRCAGATADCPFGNVEAARWTASELTVSGWAIDPGSDESPSVRLLDGQEVLDSGVADRRRPDVDRSFGVGLASGFTLSAQRSDVGRVCVQAKDAATETWVSIGCREVPPLDELPVGRVEGLVEGERDRLVRGWVFDPDDPGAVIRLHVYVDGVFAGAGRADRWRADVDRALGVGAEHGFLIPVELGVGSEACVFALNVPSGRNPLLGCVRP